MIVCNMHSVSVCGHVGCLCLLAAVHKTAVNFRAVSVWLCVFASLRLTPGVEPLGPVGHDHVCHLQEGARWCSAVLGKWMWSSCQLQPEKQVLSEVLSFLVSRETPGVSGDPCSTLVGHHPTHQSICGEDIAHGGDSKWDTHSRQGRLGSGTQASRVSLTSGCPGDE